LLPLLLQLGMEDNDMVDVQLEMTGGSGSSA
jgi:hypothetical protein